LLIREFVDDNLVDKKLEGREVVDPVWLFKEYKPKIYQIEEAIEFHKELARPEMLNNMEGFLHVRLILDMNTKKKTKFLDNVKGAVFYPNFFKDGYQKEVVAICKDDAQIEACKQAGALFAGYEDIIKKVISCYLFSNLNMRFSNMLKNSVRKRRN
jgi:large subunit ribosomal protein L1